MAKKKGSSLPVEGTAAGNAVSINKIAADDKARERRYRAEDGLRTMKEHAKITADKELMREIKKLAKDEMKNLNKIC